MTNRLDLEALAANAFKRFLNCQLTLWIPDDIPGTDNQIDFEHSDTSDGRLKPAGNALLYACLSSEMKRCCNVNDAMRWLHIKT